MAFNYEYPYTDPNRYNIDWILQQVKDVYEKIASFSAWQEEFQDEYVEIREIYNTFVSGVFPPKLIESFYYWMERNAVNLVGAIVPALFFKLTDDGHFAADIPDGWKSVNFKTTGLDIELTAEPEFGHLVLTY